LLEKISFAILWQVAGEAKPSDLRPDMSKPNLISHQKQLWPWLAMVIVLLLTVFLLRSQGRLWICACGRVYLWAGDVWSSDNSQHLLDPYSFTHVLHGFVFFWLLALIVPRLSLAWRLWLAIAIESVWEIVENSEFIIQRYRETTASLGYEGDTIVNSLGDILMCGLGFWLALQLGFRRSLALFVVTEIVLLFWIRDSLVLNVIMLIYPIEAVRVWQIGQ
jgi:hypothetical protein